jgi:hypothetical protein
MTGQLLKKNLYSKVPDWARHQDLLTDRQLCCSSLRLKSTVNCFVGQTPQHFLLRIFLLLLFDSAWC